MHVHSAQLCVFPVSFPVDLLCTAIVVNPPERKLAKPTSMQCSGLFGRPTVWFIQHIFSILLFGIIKITRLLRNTKLSMAFHFYFVTQQEKLTVILRSKQLFIMHIGGICQFYVRSQHSKVYPPDGKLLNCTSVHNDECMCFFFSQAFALFIKCEESYYFEKVIR